MCCQDCLRGVLLLVGIEEDLDYLEQFELGKNLSFMSCILIVQIVYFLILYDNYCYLSLDLIEIRSFSRIIDI